MTPPANQFETVIGLEIHIQLTTKTKIFCRCSTEFGGQPNSQVCPICLGHPGVLPVLNREAVAFALRFGYAVGARINRRNIFARKNYFYPDLPKGYQITQLATPIISGGWLRFGDGQRGRLNLTRAHLEEDAGKSFHPETGREAVTWIDLNRSGVPLLEIVSEPDLRSPDEARACLERLRQLVVYLEICDGNMEEGSLRCDANISVRKKGQRELNPKTEIKNLNSFRNVERALNWEITRQTRVLESGRTLEQTTRLWDVGENRTRVMRTKEEAHDYRYFPEPDLPPVNIEEEWDHQIRESQPELPWEKEERFIKVYGLSTADALVLAENRGLADYYETVAREAGDGKSAANWVMTEVMHLIKDTPEGWRGLKIAPENLGAMVRMIAMGTISGKIGKSVFAEMARTGGDPEGIVRSRGLSQIQDPQELDRAVNEAFSRNPGPLDDYINGKESALQFFIGQVMRITSGRANPAKARDAVKKALDQKRKSAH